MKEIPKQQEYQEEYPKKLTRRKFLKTLGGVSAGLYAFGNIAEKTTTSADERILTEEEWLGQVIVSPDVYRNTVVEAYRSLPTQLQIALRRKGIEVTFKDGEITGGAAASDQFGLDIDTHGAYIRWPAGEEFVSFQWGKIRLIDATRHEMAHIALERIFRNNSQVWTELIKALRDEKPEFFRKVAEGHRNADSIRSSSVIAAYESLQEYLASLIEHCGRPIRMPLPTGRARPMVEALVGGGDCR